ncbi:hypothetical protein GCM10018966_035640 [Streptomyces yanii]
MVIDYRPLQEKGPGRQRNDGIRHAGIGLAADGRSGAVPYQEDVGLVVTCH